VNSAPASRTVALVAVVVTAGLALYALVVGFTAQELSWGYLLQSLGHLGELAAVIALALSGAAGTGLLGRIGLGVAALGQVLLAVAELVYPANPDLGDPLFMVAPLLSGVGMVLAGIAVLRSGRWTGWHRVVPLAVGIWVLVVMTPVVIASGGPPALVALLAIAAWDVLWLLVGVSVLAEGTRDRTVAGRTAVSR
jgi:hypothetical protein